MREESQSSVKEVFWNEATSVDILCSFIHSFIHSFILVSLLHSSCLILSYLVSLMSTLEERIRDLEEEIAEYRDMLKAATNT